MEKEGSHVWEFGKHPSLTPAIEILRIILYTILGTKRNHMERLELRLDKLEKGDPLTWYNHNMDRALDYSIECFGQVRDIIVAQKRESDRYVILDGSRILASLRRLGKTTASCLSIGYLTEHEEDKIRILLGMLRYMPNDIEIAKKMEAMTKNYGIHTMYLIMPYETYEIDAFVKMAEFDWGQFKTEEDKNQLKLL